MPPQSGQRADAALNSAPSQKYRLVAHRALTYLVGRVANNEDVATADLYLAQMLLAYLDSVTGSLDAAGQNQTGRILKGVRILLDRMLYGLAPSGEYCLAARTFLAGLHDMGCTLRNDPACGSLAGRESGEGG